MTIQNATPNACQLYINLQNGNQVQNLKKKHTHFSESMITNTDDQIAGTCMQFKEKMWSTGYVLNVRCDNYCKETLYICMSTIYANNQKFKPEVKPMTLGDIVSFNAISPTSSQQECHSKLFGLTGEYEPI